MAEYIDRNEVLNYRETVITDDYSGNETLEVVSVEEILGLTPADVIERENIKLLGEELRKVREGITDEKVLIGYNMAIAICNKYLGESEDLDKKSESWRIE